MPSASDFAKLAGYSNVVGGLESLLDDWTGGTTVIIGTPAEYAIFVHEGHSKMEGRPFLKDAVEKVAREKGEQMAELATDADELLLMIGLELEAETKTQITDYGAVDTGAMRSGVAAIQL